MEDDRTDPEEDPTILEALQRFFNKPSDVTEVIDNQIENKKQPSTNRTVLVGLFFLLGGQFLIEFLREALGGIGVLLLVVGAVVTGFALLRDRLPVEKKTEPITGDETNDEISIRVIWLIVAFVTAIVASFMYKQGRFNLVSGLLWFVSLVAIVAAFFRVKTFHKANFKGMIANLAAKPGKLIAYVLLIVVVVVFQLGRLEQVPPEIISAQVEAFYTVDGLTYGDTALWFPRNVTSEPISYYWAGLVNLVSGGSLTFTGLKLAYGLAGLVAVFFMYKLGRRLYDEKSGYVAALLLGVGFWPILQQRAVLGFGLVLAIMLPALYYLFKSLEEDDLNSLLISSVLTGLGLLTNKVFFVLIIANLLITFVHLRRRHEVRPKNTLYLRVGISTIIGIVVVLPLVFVIATNPSVWIAPIVNQISISNNLEAGSPLVTFVTNILSALGMFNWLNRSSWVDGIGNRAALDWVSGAFFLFGLCVTFLKDLSSKRNQSAAVLILFFLMVLPTALSISQPMENPSLERALGAAIPVFLIAGRGLSFAAERIWSTNDKSVWVRQAIFLGIFGLLSVFSNFGLINSVYVGHYNASAWNANEMADVIRNYNIGQAGNSQAYVVGYPHWVDARAVAISMDQPYLNLSILPQDLQRTQDLQTAKIFLLHINDAESLSQLQSLYPGGVVSTYQSVNPDKNFLIYIASQ